MNAISLSAHDALRLGAILASIGISVKMIEDLLIQRHFADDGILSWKVVRLARPITAVGVVATVLDRVFSPKCYFGIVFCGLVTSLLMPLTLWYPTLLAPLSFLLLVTMGLIQIRGVYGMDGADQMNLVVITAAFGGGLAPEGSLAELACVVLVAGQSCLSYVIAGLAKLPSPVWRSGKAMPGIFSAETYGDPWFYSLIKDRPWLAKVSCWIVMVWESTFFLVFFVPLPVAIAIIGVGVLFHVSNAFLMGLNDFLWAFIAAYPSVWFCVQNMPWR